MKTRLINPEKCGLLSTKRSLRNVCFCVHGLILILLKPSVKKLDSNDRLTSCKCSSRRCAVASSLVRRMQFHGDHSSYLSHLTRTKSYKSSHALKILWAAQIFSTKYCKSFSWNEIEYAWERPHMFMYAQCLHKYLRAIQGTRQFVLSKHFTGQPLTLVYRSCLQTSAAACDKGVLPPSTLLLRLAHSKSGWFNQKRCIRVLGRERKRQSKPYLSYLIIWVYHQFYVSKVIHLPWVHRNVMLTSKAIVRFLQFAIKLQIANSTARMTSYSHHTNWRRNTCPLRADKMISQFDKFHLRISCSALGNGGSCMSDKKNTKRRISRKLSVSQFPSYAASHEEICEKSWLEWGRQSCCCLRKFLRFYEDFSTLCGNEKSPAAHEPGCPIRALWKRQTV